MRKTIKKTVLVADNDPLILSMIEQTLTPLGYDLLLASNGEEALTLMEKAESQVDLILTDVIMPGINGIDLAKQMISRNPEIRVMFMSGYLCPSIAHHGIPDSEKAFVQKPFLPNTLIKKIRSVLKSSSKAC